MVSIITMDAKRQPESIPALCVGYYTLVASGPLVFGTRALARVLISALFKGGGPLRLRNGGGLGAAFRSAPFPFFFFTSP